MADRKPPDPANAGMTSGEPITDGAGQCFAAPDHVLFRELDGEAVLLDLEGEMYFGLDAVGTRLWTLLSPSGSVQAAIDTMLDEFDVTREVLEKDVSSLIRELVARGLLEAVDG